MMCSSQRDPSISRPARYSNRGECHFDPVAPAHLPPFPGFLFRRYLNGVNLPRRRYNSRRGNRWGVDSRDASQPQKVRRSRLKARIRSPRGLTPERTTARAAPKKAAQDAFIFGDTYPVNTSVPHEPGQVVDRPSNTDGIGVHVPVQHEAAVAAGSTHDPECVEATGLDLLKTRLEAEPLIRSTRIWARRPSSPPPL